MTPDELEARSTVHSRDRFSVRKLSSGRYAIYSYTYSLITILDSLDEVCDLPELSRERIAAQAVAEQAAAERTRLLHRAALSTLEIEV